MKVFITLLFSCLFSGIDFNIGVKWSLKKESPLKLVAGCGECMITLSLPRSGVCNLAILNCAPVFAPRLLRCACGLQSVILQSVLLVQFARPGKHLISYAVVFVSEFHCSLVQLHD